VPLQQHWNSERKSIALLAEKKHAIVCTLLFFVQSTSTMIFLVLVASCILSAAAAYTNFVPRQQGHCCDMNSRRFFFDAGQSCLAATTSRNDYDLGLLTGIDVETAEYYSSKLTMDALDDVQWPLEPGRLWEAATKDAKAQGNTTDVYLKRMNLALEEFQNSGKVHDREDFYQFLGKVHTSEGQFLLVLGGKSVGKSLVLSDFAVKSCHQRNTDHCLLMPVFCRVCLSQSQC
jgi:hypothetical protein